MGHIDAYSIQFGSEKKKQHTNGITTENKTNDRNREEEEEEEMMAREWEILLKPNQIKKGHGITTKEPQRTNRRENRMIGNGKNAHKITKKKNGRARIGEDKAIWNFENIDNKPIIIFTAYIVRVRAITSTYLKRITILFYSFCNVQQYLFN